MRIKAHHKVTYFSILITFALKNYYQEEVTHLKIHEDIRKCNVRFGLCRCPYFGTCYTCTRLHLWSSRCRPILLDKCTCTTVNKCELPTYLNPAGFCITQTPSFWHGFSSMQYWNACSQCSPRKKIDHPTQQGFVNSQKLALLMQLQLHLCQMNNQNQELIKCTQLLSFENANLNV